MFFFIGSCTIIERKKRLSLRTSTYKIHIVVVGRPVLEHDCIISFTDFVIVGCTSVLLIAQGVSMGVLRLDRLQIKPQLRGRYMVQGRHRYNFFLYIWPCKGPLRCTCLRGKKTISEVLSYLPTPPLGKDMTQGQFLSGV